MRYSKLCLILSAILSMTLLSTTPAARAGQDNPFKDRFYVGVGATYAVEQFGSETMLQHYVNFDDVTGVTVRLGYSKTKHISVELAADVIHGFKWSGEITAQNGLDYQASADVDISAGSGIIKVSPGLFFGILHPYAFVGAGYMQAGRSEKVTPIPGSSTPVLHFKDIEGLFGRIGAGAELMLMDHFCLSASGGFVRGVEDVDSIRYFTATGIFSYYF